MKAASLKELKTELQSLMPEQVLELCMSLAKYKKENKELLTYLMFEANDEHAYIRGVVTFMETQFQEMNRSNTYLIKKSLRKILRDTNKYIKYSGSKQTEVELLIHFCKKVNALGVPLYANTALGNMYQRQIQKINKSLATLHEDLQYDYSQEVKSLQFP